VTRAGSEAAAVGGVGPVEPSGARLEQSIARLLTAGTYLAIVLLAIGFALMIAMGIGPLSGAPPFDVTQIPADILALQPTGFLWLGLIVVIATPSARVAASLVGYLRAGETRMAIVSVAILVVIALSIVLAKGLEG
jgi:uncharacterized membrane protein